jgi:hypothetical protein
MKQGKKRKGEGQREKVEKLERIRTKRENC